MVGTRSSSKKEKTNGQHQRKHGERNREEAIPAFIVRESARIVECAYGAGDVAKGQGNLKHNKADFYENPESPSMIECGQQDAGDNDHLETGVGNFGFEFYVPLEQ